MAIVDKPLIGSSAADQIHLCILRLQGFDEFMNVTLADAEEVWTKKDNKRVELGRILLKGDNIVSASQAFA